METVPLLSLSGRFRWCGYVSFRGNRTGCKTGYDGVLSIPSGVLSLVVRVSTSRIIVRGANTGSLTCVDPLTYAMKNVKRLELELSPGFLLRWSLELYLGRRDDLGRMSIITAYLSSAIPMRTEPGDEHLAGDGVQTLQVCLAAVGEQHSKHVVLHCDAIMVSSMPP